MSNLVQQLLRKKHPNKLNIKKNNNIRTELKKKKIPD